MPPKAKRQESKDSRGQKDSKDSQKEVTDEEIKASPLFRKLFYQEVRKRANEEEKQLVDKAFKEAKNYDELNYMLFDLDWYLDNYEDVMSSVKNFMKAIPKEEETPVKIESKIEPVEQNLMQSMRAPDYVSGVGYYQPYPQTHGQIYPQQINTMKPYGLEQYAYMREPTVYPSPQPQYFPTVPQTQYQQQPMPTPMQVQMPSQIPPQLQQQMQSHTQQQQPQPPPQHQVMPPISRSIQEKEERSLPAKEHQYQTTTEFETNAQLQQRLNSIVPLNYGLMLNNLHKQNKKATDGFYHGLYLSVVDYVRNLLDELKNICEMDSDAIDFKNYMKIGGSSGHEMDGEGKTVLMGGMEGSGEMKMLKTPQYLVKFSSIQDDQKQIEKLDDREQKDLEDKYTLSKDDDEEKITKKVKKDLTEEDEIIKFLFKTKKDKGQDNENMTKKIQETNLTISSLTSRTIAPPKTAHLHDSLSQREATGKGRKSTALQKRVSNE